ncbi:4-hydroxyphenylpyruvate dioxygenase [Actinophytocola gossypii]|uniref:4-hydroxyphenylpyruvate dioxygenase n=1 Tax=Actinophytocola gossypii TaxID=2812003 RepID=A0ABT2JGE5_9PSEU|nr:4-hydroxyphenylpyruvate dioxygenase [Actinophytocola gossypii]MCT2586818.1 4-hydroxyphenylpyruvate dioxygenase [Actinophytocola gossypii]
MVAPRPFDDLTVEHIEFYVADLAGTTEWLTGGYGLLAGPEPVRDAGANTTTVSSGDIRLLLTQPVAEDHAGATYLRRHGDGVADIALRVADAEGAFAEAVRRGARPVAQPRRHGSVLTASILGFGDVVHTFVQHLAPTGPVGDAPAGEFGLSEVDHFAVCLETGTLDGTVEFYERVLDFETIFTEKILVGAQGMDSKVVQSRSGAVTLTLIQPDPDREPGQIDDFLAAHGGAGVQHVAFSVPDIVHTVSRSAGTGVEFLSTPAAYYRLLAERLTPSRHTVEELGALSILVDEDHDGQLFQIFARSVHPRNTFFVELIERLGARTFGSGNIKALYEAVEAQRAQERAA